MLPGRDPHSYISPGPPPLQVKKPGAPCRVADAWSRHPMVASNVSFQISRHQPQLKPFHCFALPSWASFGSLPWIGKRLTTRERCRVAADGWSRHPMGRGAFGNQPDEGGSRASQRPLNILPESSWRQATQCWKQTKSSKVMERGNTAVQCRCHESFTTLPTPLSTHAICYFRFGGSLNTKFCIWKEEKVERSRREAECCFAKRWWPSPSPPPLLNIHQLMS